MKKEEGAVRGGEGTGKSTSSCTSKPTRSSCQCGGNRSASFNACGMRLSLAMSPELRSTHRCLAVTTEASSVASHCGSKTMMPPEAEEGRGNEETMPSCWKTLIASTAAFSGRERDAERSATACE